MNRKMVGIAVVLAALLMTALAGMALAEETAVQVGDFVTFGHYEQDNDASNGQEPIEWRVLKIEGDEAMIISQYGLDAQPYNEHYGYLWWKDCTLRTWLNDEFYNTAFSEEEKQAIVTHVLDNYKEADTEDTVFLLSNDEAKTLFSSHADRQTTPTAYALAQGTKTSTKYGPGNAHWWLRCISWETRQKGAFVAASGGVVTCGGEYDGRVDNAKIMVRPAVYVKLDAISE